MFRGPQIDYLPALAMNKNGFSPRDFFPCLRTRWKAISISTSACNCKFHSHFGNQCLYTIKQLSSRNFTISYPRCLFGQLFKNSFPPSSFRTQPLGPSCFLRLCCSFDSTSGCFKSWRSWLFELASTTLELQGLLKKFLGRALVAFAPLSQNQPIILLLQEDLQETNTVWSFLWILYVQTVLCTMLHMLKCFVFPVLCGCCLQLWRVHDFVGIVFRVVADELFVMLYGPWISFSGICSFSEVLVGLLDIGQKWLGESLGRHDSFLPVAWVPILGVALRESVGHAQFGVDRGLHIVLGVASLVVSFLLSSLWGFVLCSCSVLRSFPMDRIPAQPICAVVHTHESWSTIC